MSLTSVLLASTNLILSSAPRKDFIKEILERFSVVVFFLTARRIIPLLLISFKDERWNYNLEQVCVSFLLQHWSVGVENKDRLIFLNASCFYHHLFFYLWYLRIILVKLFFPRVLLPKNTF